MKDGKPEAFFSSLVNYEEMSKASKAGKGGKGLVSGSGDGERRRGKSGAKEVERSADGRYIVVDGRRWLATTPNIPEDERRRLVSELMKARRDVGRALREGDREAELDARARVQRAKVALGERGAKWWEEAQGGSRKAEG